MQSHDFASTYVGTPFYMSPEICAAERYTLQSDIWSLGCVIYELCAKAPPFNAKTHFHLIQKIKEGRLDPLPAVYSRELQNVIKDCLNVNPLKRPDTATLLDLPAVRLTRQQRDVVELAKVLKGQQAQLKQQIVQQTHTAAKTATHLENERQHLKAELEASLRREWEVKAGLEISRQVSAEKEKLHTIFNAEVSARVQAELTKTLHAHNLPPTSNNPPSPPRTAQSSFNTTNPSETDFPSTTSLSSLGSPSPPPPAPQPTTTVTTSEKSQTPPPRRRPTTRNPLARARTQFDSPMDVHARLPDPSPMSIDSLALSPRRTQPIARSKTLFANAAAARLPPLPASSSPATSTIAEDPPSPTLDTLPDLPSPTRPPTAAHLADPFKSAAAPPLALRPGLLRQKTVPVNRLQPQLFQPTAAERPARVASPPSPKRAEMGGFSPVRKAPPRPTGMGMGGQENEGFSKGVGGRGGGSGGLGGGRTLVELAQARAGNGNGSGSGSGGLKGEVLGGEVMEVGLGLGLMAPMWDPERDEMPSPFLVRGAGGRGRRV